MFPILGAIISNQNNFSDFGCDFDTQFKLVDLDNFVTEPCSDFDNRKSCIVANFAHYTLFEKTVVGSLKGGYMFVNVSERNARNTRSNRSIHLRLGPTESV